MGDAEEVDADDGFVLALPASSLDRSWQGRREADGPRQRWSGPPAHEVRTLSNAAAAD